MSVDWTFMPKFFGKRLILKSLKQGMLCVSCAFLLSACGGEGSLFGESDDKPKAQQSAPNTASLSPPQNGAAPAVLAPLEAPPGSSNAALSALQPAMGVKAEDLFTEDIHDPMERIKRVEGAVVELRQEFDSMKPALLRLIAVEGDMQDLVGQLETLLRNEPQNLTAASTESVTAEAVPPEPLALAPSAGLEPEPTAQAPPEEMAQSPPEEVADNAIPPDTPAIAPPPPSAEIAKPEPPPPAAPEKTPMPSGSNRVLGFRVGEHADKTRLVFDVSGTVSYHDDLDNDEKLLVIELSDTVWSGASSGVGAATSAIQSWSVSPLDGGKKGSRLIIVLRRESKILYEAMLKPSAGNPQPRLVIDLKK